MLCSCTMLTTLCAIVNTILPVFIMAGIGIVVARVLLPRAARGRASDSGLPSTPVEETTESIRQFLHTFTFSWAGPAYVLIALWTSTVALGDLGRPALIAVILYIVMVIVAVALGRLAGWKSEARRGSVLALASTNCANYGLPIIIFAFGEDGLVIGTIFMVTHVLMHLTLGLGIASWDTKRKLASRVGAVLKFPYIYAIALALLLKALAVPAPVIIERFLHLLGDMWIPLMLLLLGIELAQIKIGEVLKPAMVLAGLKLIVPPLCAWGLTTLLGVEGIARAVLIIQSSMPTAVNGLLVARQCNTRPDLVASTLLLSTLGSILTLSVLLGFLT